MRLISVRNPGYQGRPRLLCRLEGLLFLLDAATLAGSRFALSRSGNAQDRT